MQKTRSPRRLMRLSALAAGAMLLAACGGGFEASGAGEHLLLTVEKRDMNTAFAARRIAEWAGVGESAIGYAGLKDRHAVTRQRFSVWLPKKVAPDIAALQSDELRVLDHAWHSRKLPRGALAGNHF